LILVILFILLILFIVFILFILLILLILFIFISVLDNKSFEEKEDPTNSFFDNLRIKKQKSNMTLIKDYVDKDCVDFTYVKKY